MKEKTDPRHQARRIALQTLFEWSFLSRKPNEILRENFARLESKKSVSADKELAEKIALGVTENRQEIDKVISDCAPDWPIEQTAKIDLAILRIAVFELFIGKTTPAKVVIDEAVELGKEFGSEKSGNFVNGVLGTVVEKLGNV
ncbi:MAG: transcription antitermination factor NusB [Candidatus Cloacimonetes bacterium]|nr:transcription antitermination factor NusB [Candidatus Cloacimonadota bacterium]